MSLSPTKLQWPGPMFSSFDLPYSDGLASSITGAVTSLQGTDPAPYALSVWDSWTGAAGPAKPDAGKLGNETPAQPAAFGLPSLGDLASGAFWKRAGVSAAGAVLAVALVILGLYFLLRGSD